MREHEFSGKQTTYMVAILIVVMKNVIVIFESLIYSVECNDKCFAKYYFI